VNGSLSTYTVDGNIFFIYLANIFGDEKPYCFPFANRNYTSTTTIHLIFAVIRLSGSADEFALCSFLERRCNLKSALLMTDFFIELLQPVDFLLT